MVACDYTADYEAEVPDEELFLYSRGDKSEVFRIRLDRVDIFSSEFDYFSYSNLFDDYDRGKLTIELIENGQLIDALIPWDDSWEDDLAYQDERNWGENKLFRLEDTFDFKTGASYELVIDHEDYPLTTAETTILPEVEIIEFEQTKDSIYHPNLGYFDEYHVVFDDPDDEKNYYKIRTNVRASVLTFIEGYGERERSELLTSYIYYNNNDIDITGSLPDYYRNWSNLYSEIYLTDENAIDGVVSLDLEVSSRKVDAEYLNQYGDDREFLEYYVELNVMNITEEYYDYAMAVTEQSNSHKDLFSTPMPVPSNVENGAGFFTITSASKKKIHYDSIDGLITGSNTPWE
ncbi:MAG: DUF4249 domain-containing protein [Reichenbachiella sp.]